MTKAEIEEQILKECHEYCESILTRASGKVSYQNATNVFLFSKLAEIELRLRKLEEKGGDNKISIK